MKVTFDMQKIMDDVATRLVNDEWLANCFHESIASLCGDMLEKDKEIRKLIKLIVIKKLNEELVK